MKTSKKGLFFLVMLLALTFAVGCDKTTSTTTTTTTPPVTTTTAAQYSVSFYAGDTLIETVTVEQGSAATAPSAPVKVGYTFKEWDKAFSNITADLTVHAVYEQNAYNVSFYSGDALIETKSVKYGEAAVAPTAPSKEGYTFKEWDKAFSNITADLTVHAVYEQNSYNVSFYAGDTLIETVSVKHGEAATAPTAPAKEGYTFTAWDKAFATVTSELTVNAVYEQISYNVSFYAGDTLIETVSVKHGEAATAPTAPAKEGFNFSAWDISFTNVTANLTVNAVYVESDPIISVISETNNPALWTGTNEQGDAFVGIENGAYGLNLKIASAFYGTEYRTPVTGSALSGNTLVFYVSAPSTAEIFVRFYYADGSNTQYMIQTTSEGLVKEIPLSSFIGLNLASVTGFGFFIQDWGGTAGWSTIEVDAIAICDAKGLAEYKESHTYEPIISVISDTTDPLLWSGTNEQGATYVGIEKGTIGLNLKIASAFYGTEYRTPVTGSALAGNTLAFYISAPATAEIFVRFFYADGTFVAFMIQTTPEGLVKEIPLSSFAGLNLASVTGFGFFIQDWGGAAGWSTVTIDAIAICDVKGLALYKETHVYVQEPVVSVISETNDPTLWTATNATNPAFAVVESATTGLNFKFVSSHDGSEFKTAVDGTKLSGNTLTFHVGAAATAQIFVRFYYADGSNNTFMIQSAPEGQTIEIPLSSFSGLDLTSVTQFGFFIQDWTAAFGWTQVNIDNITIITK